MKRLLLSLVLFFTALGVHAQPSAVNYCVSGYTSTGATIAAPCSATNPLTVTAAATTATFSTINQVVAVTGTAVQLTTAGTPLVNGLTCLVIAAGTNKLSIGKSTTVTNPQSVAFSASAVGAYLVNAQSFTVAVNNATAVFINGTAADGVTCWGN